MSFSYQEEVQPQKSVGESVYDILSKDQPDVQVGEIISDYGDQYTEEIRKTLEANVSRMESPFYIVVLHKKEPWALNVMRNYFVARQTKPFMKDMLSLFPNHMHTVYEFNKSTSELKLLWSLPGQQEITTILDNWALYDPVLVRWCMEAKGIGTSILK